MYFVHNFGYLKPSREGKVTEMGNAIKILTAGATAPIKSE